MHWEYSFGHKTVFPWGFQPNSNPLWCIIGISDNKCRIAFRAPIVTLIAGFDGLLFVSIALVVAEVFVNFKSMVVLEPPLRSHTGTTGTTRFTYKILSLQGVITE
jgi:hypothetical protein